MSKEVLNLTYYKGEDLYSEGPIEDRMLEMYESGQDTEQILMDSNEWGLLYHLSDIRHNLLEWYDVPEGSNVLEIGAGCGAITGLLCRKFDKVKCIELSRRRSMINAARNKEFDNLEIYVGNFEDIEIEEKFDYVTLIGVFEYSASYIHSDDSYGAMLEKVKNFLKPGGTLIIAIENRFGLKYLAGASEDHTAGFFDGIDGYKDVDWVRTFSKNEISDILSEHGFGKTEFYYPVPDYKMPKFVYSERYLPKRGNLRGMSAAFDRDRFKLFDEDSVFDRFTDDQLFEYFANSFLIFTEV